MDVTVESGLKKWASTSIWSIESMIMMMFPWCRAESLSSQRGNSSKILLGSMDKPEMDQKCCSSYVTTDKKTTHPSVIKAVYTEGHPCLKNRGSKPMTETPYFDCEAFDNENWLWACRKRTTNEMIKEQGVGGLLLLQLNPEKDKSTISKVDTT